MAVFLCLLLLESSPSDSVTIQYRNPTGALLRSMALPGWGQFYNEKPAKGVMYGVFELGLLGLLLYEHDRAENAREMHISTGLDHWENRYETHSGRRRDLIWYTAGAWLVGMLDAYVDAYLFSFEAENTKFDGDVGFRAGMVFDFSL